ncbi:MAG: hypothetical protein HOP96_07280 [Sphingomonas sp.]|nr:hypothetical protein [Sphingomonas sp.]
MPRNNSRTRNNNPTGRNQYSSDWMGAVKDRPITAAATAAAAVGAGVFLWSKRNQISEQLSNLSDQISDWTESMRSSGEEEFETADETSGAAIGSTSARTSRSTGSRPTSTRSRGGNASLGADTGPGSEPIG